MIRQIEWSEEAAAGLLVSADGDLDLIRGEVMRGAAQLWRYSEGDETKGFAVTRLELTGSGTELVIVLFEGRGLVDSLLPLLIEEAKRLGINSARAHIKRLGLLRVGRRYGFELDHYVIRSRF